jgi:hypothetical protein
VIGSDITMTAWINVTDLPAGTNGGCWAGANARTIMVHEDSTSKVTYGMLHYKESANNLQYLTIIRNKDGVATGCLPFRVDLPVNQLVFIGLTFQSGNLSLWYNGTVVNQTSSLTGNGSSSTGDQMTIGAGTGGGDTTSGSYNGLIDEVNVWNRALNQSEMNFLKSDKGFYPFSNITTESLNISLVLKTYNGTIYPSISTIDDFNINLNYTNTTGVKPDSNCSFNGYNLSYSLEYHTYQNILFTDTIKTESIITNEGFVNATQDIIRFRVCGSAGVTANILINGSLFRTISDATIPDCNALNTTYHEELNITKTTINNRSLNISVKCSGLCGIAGRSMRLIYDEDGGIIHYFRTFSQHSETMSYNSSSKLYEYKNDQYISFVTPLNITAR